MTYPGVGMLTSPLPTHSKVMENRGPSRKIPREVILGVCLTISFIGSLFKGERPEVEGKRTLNVLQRLA